MRALSRRGQSTVEYALVISVLALALIAAAWPFSHDLVCGMQDYSSNAETFYADPGQTQIYPSGGYDTADYQQKPTAPGVSCP